MLERFKELKSKLLLGLDELEAFTARRDGARKVEAIHEIAEKLRQNRFYLVVLGEFKRGKTTFINALLGRPLLPTAVVPLTSIVTMMKHGERQGVEVIFKDGRVERIDMEEIADYVTERGNPGNRKEVDRVEVSFPSDFLRDGVYLIDTPGVGSVYSNNTEMTYSFLPKADAAIFLVSADPPISQSEVAFLKEVSQWIRKIFFVQNKVDRLSEEEREESIAFTREVLKEVAGLGEVDLHPLSAKEALEAKVSADGQRLHNSYLPRLQRVLEEFLMKEKGRELLRSASTGSLRLISEQTLALEIEMKALETPLQDLEEKLRAFQQQMEQIKQDEFDSQVLFEGEIKRLVQQIDMDLERFKRNEVSRMMGEMEEAHKRHKGSSAGEYAKAMEGFVQDQVVKGFDSWLEGENKRIEAEYARIAKRFQDGTNEIIDRILEISSGLFDLQVERFAAQETLSTSSELYYMVGDPPRFFDLEGALKFISRSVLPRPFSLRMIFNDLKKKLPEIIDRNCGRVRADFVKRLQDSYLQFRWDLGEKIEATRKGIESAIQKTVELKRERQGDVASRREELKVLICELEGIRGLFRECLNAVELGLDSSERQTSACSMEAVEDGEGSVLQD